MSDTPRTDRASHLCHPWTLPTDHEALSKFRLLANEMAKLERELAETKRLLAEASKAMGVALKTLPHVGGNDMSIYSLTKNLSEAIAAIKEQK